MSVGGRNFQVATKPGLLNHGRDDVAMRLLAEKVAVAPSSTVAHLNCGSGLFGAVACISRGAAKVVLTDRSIVAVEAAKRTFAMNGLSPDSVILGHGSAPLGPETWADVVAIRIPTEKIALLHLLADAFEMLNLGGQCCIAGATTEGIKSAAGLLEARFRNTTVLGTDSGHRAVMAIKRHHEPRDASLLDDEALRHDSFRPLDVAIGGSALHLFSRPGVFSWDHLDDATRILGDVLDVRPDDDVLDLGCGSGALGMLAARRSGTGRVRLVDVDSEAIRCVDRAIGTMHITNATALCSDVADAVRDERFDVVITNPPFHVGKSTDLDVPSQFILDAWQVLKPGGRLMLVANRTLPYERLVQATFGNLTTVHDGARFKVLAARR
ncbi:MAG: methyltransferase [Gemmatimonadaceae bacterium]|nr:methyltransferase [Gemmatimonadaceae bacterium]